MLPNPFEKYGIKFAATYIGETLGNASGGLKQGLIYEGRLNLAVDVDLEKLAGLREVTFHANMFQIHGDGLSRSYLNNFMVASGIEALPSTRLYEIWFEKKWGDKFALRAGQLAADTEFINAKYTDVFTNASLGWPAIVSVNLPSGGPSPPLAALGVRARANVNDNLTIVAGIFDGDAAGPGPQDPQIRDNAGINFRINDPPLVIGEVQYIWNGKKGDPGLDGKFKVGGWRHFGEFADQRITAQGVSLASPLSSGVPASLSQNSGIYSVFEQKLYRVGNDDDRGIGIFARVSSSPGDRNLIDLYADGGTELIGLSDARPKDKFGIAPRLAVVVDVDTDDHVGAGQPQALQHVEADAAEPEHDRLGALLDLGGVDHGADAGGDAAADVADPVERRVLADLRDRDFRQRGVVRKGRGAHVVMDGLAADRETRGAVGHQALALGGTDRGAEIGLARQAGRALPAFRRVQGNDVVTLLDAGDALADVDHDARAFMAENGGKQPLRVGA